MRRDVMSIRRAETFLEQAQTGWRMCYHVGHLGTDRVERVWGADGTPLGEQPIEPLNGVAVTLFEACKTRRVALYQTKCDEGYEYWVVRL